MRCSSRKDQGSLPPDPSAEHPGIVGNDLLLGVVVRVGVLVGDGVGDRLDYPENGSSTVCFTLVRSWATPDVSAYLVDELGAVTDLAGLPDEDLSRADGDGFYGAVSEVDEAR